MDLTTSYSTTIPSEVLNRYEWAETRNAAAILAATNPDQFSQFIEVIREFTIDIERDIITPGGNESGGTALLNKGFRNRGWREGDYNQTLTSRLRFLPYSPAGETHSREEETTMLSPSYLIDNIRGRVALDVEWHAKDGNLDRDFAAYRALYESGIIDAAIMITTKREDMRSLAVGLDRTSKKWMTSTTTNLTKAIPKLTRGDGGGCPILIAAVCSKTI